MKYFIIALMVAVIGITACQAKSEERLITFTDLSDTYIDFDFDQNKWIYHGDLEAIGREIWEHKLDSYQAISALETYRQLREQEKEEKKDILDLTIKGISARSEAFIIFSDNVSDSPEIFRIEAGGDIYWRGRKVDTDRELGKAFMDVIRNNVCPKCREQR